MYRRIEKPLINILIRTSDRPKQFSKCLQSVLSQTYKNIKILVYDNSILYDYVPPQYLAIKNKNKVKEYEYNLFCNTLKSMVQDGYFFFLDDDDTLYDNHCLEYISHFLDDYNKITICQFLRNGFKKPSDTYMTTKTIKKGKIGMPCIFVPHNLKLKYNISNAEDGDYKYIKNMTETYKTQFVQAIIVNSKQRNKGAKEICK